MPGVGALGDGGAGVTTGGGGAIGAGAATGSGAAVSETGGFFLKKLNIGVWGAGAACTCQARPGTTNRLAGILPEQGRPIARRPCSSGKRAELRAPAGHRGLDVAKLEHGSGAEVTPRHQSNKPQPTLEADQSGMDDGW
jgi:hypothetical protein